MLANLNDPFEDEEDTGIEEDQWYSDASSHDEGWGGETEEDVPEEPEDEQEIDPQDENWDA